MLKDRRIGRTTGPDARDGLEPRLMSSGHGSWAETNRLQALSIGASTAAEKRGARRCGRSRASLESLAILTLR